MFKIYWFFLVLKNIKQNNLSVVKTIVEKYFKKRFLTYFLKYSYCYSYDCFEYLLLKLQKLNGSNHSPQYYESFRIRKDFNEKELEKVFNYPFNNELDKDDEGNFNSKSKKNQLQSQIILNLLKSNQVYKSKYDNHDDNKSHDIILTEQQKNKEKIIGSLLSFLPQENREKIFRHYFDSLWTVYPQGLKRVISIFNIDKSFFDENVFSLYGLILNVYQYEFLKDNYNFSPLQWEMYFLKIENNAIIEDIFLNHDLKYNIVLEKIAQSLKWSYEYNNDNKIIEKILLYKKLNLLTDENILNSFKYEKTHIFIDYHYLPLLDLSKEVEQELIRNNLKLIILYLYNNLDYKMYKKSSPEKLKKFYVLLDNYFEYVSKNLTNLENNNYIKGAIKLSAQLPQHITLYLYKKFPELFIENAYYIFSKIIHYNDASNHHEFIKEIIKEKEEKKRHRLIDSVVRALVNSYYGVKMSDVYTLIKNELTVSMRRRICDQLVSKTIAFPIVEDLLKGNYEGITINHIFSQSLGIESPNTLYILDNYKIQSEYLSQGFLKLSAYPTTTASYEVAKKILEKKIQLSEQNYEQLQRDNIEMFKLYSSYHLNEKLSNKLKPKEVKVKKLKI